MGRVELDTFMSDTDALMWNMERDPRLRGTATTVLLLDAVPEWDRFVGTMERVTRLFPRFRQRVVDSPLRLGPPRWVFDPRFDLGYHLRREAAPAPGDLRTVLDMAQPWSMAAFDKERPLWEYTLVEGLADGGGALVQKVHHALSDGIGGMDLALEFFDEDRAATDRGPMPPEPRPEEPGRVALAREALGWQRDQWTHRIGRLPGRVASLAGGALRHPLHTGAEALRLGRSVSKILAPMTDTLSPVMLDRSLGRHFGAVDVPLDDVKRAAKAADGTVNDAFLAGVAGGLRRYHERHDAPVDSLRVAVPVSVRRADDPQGGNRLTTIRYEIPAAEPDPAKRVAAIHEATRAMLDEPAVEATASVAGLLNQLPRGVMAGLFGSMLVHIDVLASNVPGFPTTPYVAGAAALRWYAFGPTEGAAMNVTLLSHAGRCCIGINSDLAAVPDPDTLVGCVEEGVAEVLALAN